MILAMLNLLLQSFIARILCRRNVELLRAVNSKQFLILFLFIIMVSGCTNHSLEQLPHFQDISYKHEFKVEPYICTAVALQKMGFEHACQDMLMVAKRENDSEQLYVLCRMLFQKRGTSEFRRPWIGGAVFLGGTDYSDWPLEPIELVDGVPFVISRGYTVHGALPESPEAYLKYCITNCDWNAFQYQVKSRDELNQALNKLLISTKWKHPLEYQEHEILAGQVK